MISHQLDNRYLALVNDERILDAGQIESVSIIVRECIEALSACRSSVWLFDDNKTELRSLVSLTNNEKSDEDGSAPDMVFKRDHSPSYFEALETSRIIQSSNPAEDERTSELHKRYLKPLSIQTSIDVPLRLRGSIRGVLRIEMVEQQRSWSTEEQMFATSIADLLCQRLILEEEEIFKAVYEFSSEGIVVFGGAHFIDANPAMCEIFGASSKEDLIGKTPFDVSPEFQPDGSLSAETAMAHVQACLGGEPQNFEFIHTRIDGTPFDADITLNAVKLSGTNTLFAIVRDISEKKAVERQAAQAQEKLKYRASRDSLTGLLNREQLHRHVNDIINKEGAEEAASNIALLLLDLNRFKEVNDTLGHSVGDQVLLKLAETLNESVEAVGGCLFRLGGDEFVAVFDDARCNVPLDQLASIIHNSLKTSIDLDDMKIEMGASIGVAQYPVDGDGSHELLRCADVAMYHAKNNGEPTSFYNTENDLNNKRRLSMNTELATAIQEDQLVLHFQPRIKIDTGAVTGCEALVRWEHPKLGLIPPYEFLPFAEMGDLIHPLTNWVLINVVKQIKHMVACGNAIPVAMNISARNLTDSSLIENIKQIISEENIDPRLLEIEITESALINHPQRAVENLEKLAELGIPIAIDDFGTGYSSLSYLKKLPLDTLKIDQSFVKDMLTDESDSVIVDSTINLSHNFSLTVVAEGVEDKETLDELALKHCDQAQGFFIARPMPAKDLDSWLINRPRDGNTLPLAS